MKRLFLFMALLLMLMANAVAQKQFKHPGGILSQSDLDRIKLHINAGDEPWASCWKSLQADNYAKNTRMPSNPVAEIGGKNGERQRAAGDAYAAMLNAIEWHVTGNTAYADCAVRLLSAWGNTMKSASGELFQYPGRALILAAEMLRNSDGSFYKGWAEADRDTFLNKVRTILCPAFRKFCTYTNSHPSWYTPCGLGLIAAGVLLDDEAIYKEGYGLMTNTDHWGTMFGGSIEPNGQMREMGRDNVHGGLTLGDIAQACLVAWNQGDDLFGAGDNRLLKGTEYWCRYNTGHTDTPFVPQDCSGLDNATGFSFYFISVHNNGFRLRPDACCFEAVYHHYKEVKGMDAEKNFPYLTIATRLARPDTNNQMLGYGTLLFTINADASPYMTEVPDQPVDFKAEDGFKCIYLSWKHPEKEDARGFRLYRSTDGKSFSLLTTMDYYTNNEYKDENVEPGKTYYYKVQLINRAGYSQQSEIASATPQAGTDELPSGWGFMGVNSSSFGNGLFTTAQDTTFVVSGVGKDIGGTSDQHGYLYKKVTGDATITVRLTSTKEAFYKVGLLMRSSLTANSQRVGLTLGDIGYRMLRMCTRSSNEGNTSWINGTNYAYAPFWLRMERKGNLFTTYASRDNENWVKVASVTVAMPKTYYLGMASCTGKATGTAYQAVFDHVSVDGTTATPIFVPSAPSGLKASWTDSRQASLTWNNVADADSFIVYRASNEVDFDSVAMVRATRYVDTVDLPGTYSYKLAAKNVVGKSRLTAAVPVNLYDIEQLKGTVIGTAGSWNNNSSTTKYAAVDNKLNTYFDATVANGAWVGYDMGNHYTAQTTYVKYAPRTGYSKRMVGGRFQVATKSDFSDARTIATVDETPYEGVLTRIAAPSGKSYRYLRYISPDGGNCNVAEVQFFGRKIGDSTTGLNVIEANSSLTDAYTIGGIKVNTLSKGQVYVKKRKKFIKH